MKAKALALMRWLEVAVNKRWVYLCFSWVPVAMGLVSIPCGLRWAAAAGALALGVIAWAAMSIAGSLWLVADGFQKLRDAYAKELQGTEKKEPETTPPMS